MKTRRERNVRYLIAHRSIENELISSASNIQIGRTIAFSLCSNRYFLSLPRTNFDYAKEKKLNIDVFDNYNSSLFIIYLHINIRQTLFFLLNIRLTFQPPAFVYIHIHTLIVPDYHSSDIVNAHKQ